MCIDYMLLLFLIFAVIVTVFLMEQETNETFPFTTVYGNPDFSDQSITTNYAKHVKQPVSMGTDCKKININGKGRNWSL